MVCLPILSFQAHCEHDMRSTKVCFSLCIVGASIDLLRLPAGRHPKACDHVPAITIATRSASVLYCIMVPYACETVATQPHSIGRRAKPSRLHGSGIFVGPTGWDGRLLLCRIDREITQPEATTENEMIMQAEEMNKARCSPQSLACCQI
jgi:hypothetical protein